jgi:GntR family transcriptional regulator
MSAALPLYEGIVRDLIGAIDDGRHPVGSLLPTELELAERYGVSRQTVRTAMQRLGELGAVSRRQGSGTRVAARQQPEQGYQQTLASVADLVALAAATTRIVQSVETVVMDRADAKRLGCTPGSRWVRMAYVRQPTASNLKPLGWVDCYVDERYGEILHSLGNDPSLVSDIVARKFGVLASEVKQEVSANLLSLRHAAALKATPGMPALQVLRRYYDRSGSLFELSVSTHPADRYVVTSNLKRVRAA